MAKEHYSPEVITARLKGKRWEDHREYLANYNKYEERGFTVIEYDVMERQGDYAAASVGSANIFHKLVRHDKKYIDSNDNEIREVEAQKLRNQYIAEQQKAKEAEERKQQEANKQKAKEEQDKQRKAKEEAEVKEKEEAITKTAHEWGETVGGIYGGSTGGEIGNYIGKAVGGKIGKSFGYQGAGEKTGKCFGSIAGAAIGGNIGGALGGSVSQAVATEIVKIGGIDTVGTTLPPLVGAVVVGGVGIATSAFCKTANNPQSSTFNNVIDTASTSIPMAAMAVARSIPFIDNSPTALGVLSYGTQQAVNYYKHGSIDITFTNVAKGLGSSIATRTISAAIAVPVGAIVGSTIAIVAVPVLAASATAALSYGVNQGVRCYSNSCDAEKAKKLNVEATKHHREGQYEEALVKFNKATALQPNNKIYHKNKAATLIKLTKYDEAIEAADKALHIDLNYKQAKEQKAFALNELAKVDSNAQNYEEALIKFNEAIVLQPNNEIYQKNKATVLNEQGKKLWNDAWTAEETASLEEIEETVEQYLAEAKEKFKETKVKFKQAHKLVPDNTEYTRNFHMISLKIEGNSNFNEGVKLQYEANNLRDQGKYEQALKKYTTAMQKFQNGLKHDARFQDCIDLVKESITICNTKIEEIGQQQHYGNLEEYIPNPDTHNPNNLSDNPLTSYEHVVTVMGVVDVDY
ncbi:tetratricopeptide repeat protein [Candidatus Tisiphia endosymbiont of Melanophora roralis]|jgi:tetratricopeptide (TPR) repeat protein/ribosomal protein L9|uniref:tetratricopeptide repeat protein n=1 Tax=Candidatus Tisiphia endosymbiont of Melanophora roralis TaxID=3066261 RepID=UPI001E70C77A|nr:MAG: hypothetical protein LF884_02305 [Rickettsia endosymbiont of Cimex lectularius]